MAEKGHDKYEFKIYNSMTKKKEKFKPIVPGKVSMYVCGVTSYDFSHIGHARAYVAFDVLFRYLDHLGYEVTYVRNFTDIDDKIIERAKELREDPLSLSQRFCQEFLTDMADLNCLPPNEQPRVSDHMDQIRNMIQKIISNNCAYAVDGDVYFSVDNFPNYGSLSGRKLQDNKPGQRIPIDSKKKRNPADFALWKAAKPGEISWASPWGPGRPGWHIECSAMSATYLTENFDIHGGGMDLIFPHHENEIAQSCAACPNSNITYWMHNGFVNSNDEKMSKSKGNFFTIREVTKLYHPLALRHFLLGTHYRSPVNYSIDQIEISSEAVFKIYQALEDFKSTISQFQQVTESSGKKDPITNDAQKCIKNLRSHFEEKLSDDLHTTSILNIALQDAIRLMNIITKNLKKQLQKQLLKLTSLMELKDVVQKQLQKLQLSNIKTVIELKGEVKCLLKVLELLSGSTYAEGWQALENCEIATSQFQKVTSGEEYPITNIDARKRIENLRHRFEEKSDDLHTPTILNAALQDALRLVSTILKMIKNELQKPQELSSIKSLIELEKEVTNVLRVLGLLSSSNYSEVLEQLKEKARKRAGVTEEYILQRIEERESHRNKAKVTRNKDEFKLGDKIRTDLESKGIALEDVDDHTIWRPCVPKSLVEMPSQQL